MTKLKLLDLFCGGGGAAMGYYRAGFDVTGVDNKPHPEYPFEFVLANAMTFSLEGYDVIHASPPCQAHSQATVAEPLRERRYVDLVKATRRRLRKSGRLYVIENVPVAPLNYLNCITLCGTMFGLPVLRHRIFEHNVLLKEPQHEQHRGSLADGTYIPVYGGKWTAQITVGPWTTESHRIPPQSKLIETWQAALGIDWISRRGVLAQAIPPSYTEYIGKQLMESYSC